MKDLRKRASVYLLITFLLGGMLEIIQYGYFDIAQFIQLGVGFMFFTIPIGMFINYILKVFGIRNAKSKQKFDDEILDSPENSELLELELKIYDKLNIFKYATYFTAIILLVNLFGKLL